MGADTSRRQIIDDMPQNHRTGSWAERKGGGKHHTDQSQIGGINVTLEQRQEEHREEIAVIDSSSKSKGKVHEQINGIHGIAKS